MSCGSMKTCVTTVLLLLLVVCVCVKTVEGCSCFPTHPQLLYCSANTVVLAEVVREKKLIGNSDETVYKIIVKKVLKGAKQSNIQYAVTQKQPGMCGVGLEPGQYMLSGSVSNRRMTITLCDIVKDANKLSSKQKQALSVYKTLCDGNCKISWCSGGSCVQNECLLNRTNSYEIPFQQGDEAFASVCRSDNTGRCNWSLLPKL